MGQNFIQKAGVVKRHIQKTGRFVRDNKWCFVQLAVMVSWQGVCGATIGGDINTGMPFDSGVNVMQSALTGPLPKAGSVISIATGASMWMFGQGQISQTAIRATLGSGVALGAPSALAALAGPGIGSGCIFF